MSRKQTLPYDVRQECLWIVRGYERRVKAYYGAVRQIVDGSGNDDTGIPGSRGCIRSVENKAAQLEAVEGWPETKRMRAVEQAKHSIGADLENEELRQRLAEGIILNCKSRHEYPFRYLGLDGISQRDFYRRKEMFIVGVAKCLHII